MNNGPKFSFFMLLVPFSLLGQAIGIFSLVEDPDDPYFGAISFQPASWQQELLTLEDEDWNSIIKCYSPQNEQMEIEDLPAMLGKMVKFEGKVFWLPRFPLMQGRSYLAVLEIEAGFKKLDKPLPGEGDAVLRYRFTVPQLSAKAPPFVEGIYPTSSNWPANQLKFYIYFSTSMRLGQAATHIQLLDDQGQEVEAPFLIEGQELWDHDGKRLTVWFDPGRIKRGLIPNLKYGPPLEAGRRYTLVIKKEWQDVNGQELEQAHKKEIKVIRADRTMPEASNWLIIPPQMGGKEPLRLFFNEPMDYALMNSAIAVVDEKGNLLEGHILIREEEKQWLFSPVQPWKTGQYKIRISHDLEDLGGNNLIRLFDSDVDAIPLNQFSAQKPYVELPFSIKNDP